MDGQLLLEISLIVYVQQGVAQLEISWALDIFVFTDAPVTLLCVAHSPIAANCRLCLCPSSPLHKTARRSTL